MLDWGGKKFFAWFLVSVYFFHSRKKAGACMRKNVNIRGFFFNLFLSLVWYILLYCSCALFLLWLYHFFSFYPFFSIFKRGGYFIVSSVRPFLFFIFAEIYIIPFARSFCCLAEI